MTPTELLELVRTTSLGLMNAGKGDGTIYHCYDDAEILERFSDMGVSDVVAEVAQLDGMTKEYFDEVLLASGEYRLDDAGRVVPIPQF